MKIVAKCCEIYYQHKRSQWHKVHIFHDMQDLGRVLICCSLVSPLKILSYDFFSHRIKVY